MIEIAHVSKAYGTDIVVDDVSLTLPAGGLTAIVGPNGAGKSTLLSIVARLVPMTSGRVTVDGLDITRTPGHVFAKRLAILRQDNHVMPRLTVAELVAFGRYPHSKGRLTVEDEAQIAAAIAYVELEALRGRYLDELSGGQRQRAFVAMLIAQGTDYMLLDEPLNNLDMKHAAGMMKLLRRAADEFGKTVAVVVHDINFASCYADAIVAMKHGRVVFQGPPADFMQRDVLRDIYEIDVTVSTINGRNICLYYE